MLPLLHKSICIFPNCVRNCLCKIRDPFATQTFAGPHQVNRLPTPVSLHLADLRVLVARLYRPYIMPEIC